MPFEHERQSTRFEHPAHVLCHFMILNSPFLFLFLIQPILPLSQSLSSLSKELLQILQDKKTVNNQLVINESMGFLVMFIQRWIL